MRLSDLFMAFCLVDVKRDYKNTNLYESKNNKSSVLCNLSNCVWT